MVSIPWWDALKLRDEIFDSSGQPGGLQVSLYRAIHGQGADRPKYADSGYYGKITEPTAQLVELLAQIAIRLGGGRQDQGRALIRLDQGMGGGKSHACIGAWHLATDPPGLATEDIGRQVFDQAEAALGQPLPRDLNRPHAVVMSCDNMTPGSRVPEQDGEWAFNLYERFLWRLFADLRDQQDRFEGYRQHFASKAKIEEALRSLNRPVLIIFDEILNYIGDGLEAVGDQQLTAQDMAFLRALTEAVTSVPNVSMIVVMINSEKDPTTLQGGGEARRADLESYLQRQGPVATSVNENADFTSILHRRLFATPVSQAASDQAVSEATAALRPVLEQDTWKSRVFGKLNGNWTRRFEAEVARTFPFHPQLMDLAETEWANLAGFQQVRSTIMIFAATVQALAERAKREEWVPLLIGPGDLPLSNDLVRRAVIGSGLIKDTKTQGNYRSIAQSDIVNLEDADGAARRLDLSRTGTPWADSNPRAAERAATMMYLASIVGSRGGSLRGASDPEVKAATMVPDPAYEYAEADSVVLEVVDVEARGLATVEIIEGRGGQPRRYFLSTQQRLPMLIRAMRNTVTDEERHEAVAERARALLKADQFAEARFVPDIADQSHRGVLVAADLDKPRATRLFALDPARFTVGNGTQRDTIDAVTAVLGLGPDPVAVQWAPSAVFLVASARGAALAGGKAAEYVAYQKVLTGPEIETDDEMAVKARTEREEARKRLDEAVQRAFQHVYYLAQPDPSAARTVTPRSLDKGTLHGSVVWEELAEAQKAFRPGAFNATALLHNLRDNDYQRPLSEFRDAFWNTPRLSLLPGDGSDLRQAIFQAVSEDKLRIVRAGGETVVVSDLTGINFNAPTYRLAKPVPPEPPALEMGPPPPNAPPAGPQGDGDGGPDIQHPRTEPPSRDGNAGERSPAEKVFAFSVMKNLASDPAAAENLAQLFRRLFDLLDRGSISYLQGTLQVQLPSDQAQDVADLARSLGINITIRDR